MSTYKIKLEDKAAFLNRLEKQDIAIDSFDIKDNKLEGYFEITVDDPQVNEVIKTILKQSPKINKIKEMKTKLTVKKLSEIIREELAEAGYKKKEEKQQLSEISWADPMVWGPLVALLISVGAISTAVANDLKSAKTPEEKKEKLKNALGGIEKATGTGS